MKHGASLLACNMNDNMAVQAIKNSPDMHGRVDLSQFHWVQQTVDSALQFLHDVQSCFVTDVELRVKLGDTNSTVDSNSSNNDNSSTSASTLPGPQTRFKANKQLIMARCPKFAAMFHSNMLEAQQGTVDITVAPQQHQAFSLFISFLTTGYVPDAEQLADTEIVMELAVLADEYLVESLKRVCENSLEFQLTLRKPGEKAESEAATAQVINFLCFADQMSMGKLRAKCISTIAKNFSVYSQTKEFLSSVVSNIPLMTDVLVAWNNEQRTSQWC